MLRASVEAITRPCACESAWLAIENEQGRIASMMHHFGVPKRCHTSSFLTDKSL